MIFFKNKKTEQTTVRDSIPEQTTVRNSIPANHISKKKKNTYTIRFSPFCDEGLFSLCQTTPLAVITLNGRTTQPDSGFISCTHFPNPRASIMATQQHLLQQALGSKISTTIIEYLDKDTGAPVCQLYPHALHIFDGYKKTYLQHLNHASRRDLQHQIKIREQLLRKVYGNQK